MSTPSTTLNFCTGVRLNNKYDHTIYFATKEDQDAYFERMTSHRRTDYSYQRKSGTLKIATSFENARLWSYMFFTNSATSKKYFYFINNVEYVNESTTLLTLELDVIQTYMFDWQLVDCFVEREHSVTDEIGKNTVDEGLDVGDHVVKSVETIDLSSDIVLMTAASIDINSFYISGGETVDKIMGSRYDNVFGGFAVTATDLNNYWDDFAIMLNYLNTKGQSDTIYTMWQYPKKLIETHMGKYEFTIAEYVRKSKTYAYTATGRSDELTFYKPRNKKLLQYPYQFIYASNNSGGACVYRYEWFADPSAPIFKVKGNISPDAIVKMIPHSYNGYPADNNENALAMTNFPVCAWNSDVYKLWLAQNQNSQNLGFVMSGLKIAGGAAAVAGGLLAAPTGVGLAAAGAGVGSITSGVSGIASILAQRADKEIQPPEAKGTYSGNYNIANGNLNFTLYHKTIDYQHAAIIDNFFDMYGYATRRVKKPNISSRPHWNYVKTIGSNIFGRIPKDDLRQINDIFDKGITFWKNGDNIGLYGLDNSPTE